MVALKNQFPESFFEEEVRNGFTITRKRKEIWAVELDMLIELDKACKALGIKYFLDSGTLLGAVRDGHFIPWDDDIDVVMLREDYDKFVAEGSKYFQHPLFLQNAYTEDGYFRMHSQIRNSETTAILPNEIGKVKFNQGIFMDVFVLDGINDQTIKKQLRKKRIYRKIYNMQAVPESENPIKQIIKGLVNGCTKKIYGGQKQLYSRIENTFRGNDDSEYVDSLMLTKKNGNIYKLKREWYNECDSIMFEGMLFSAPYCYKDVLRIEYGDDWRTPKNVPSVHGAEGDTRFDTDRSYKAFIQ